MSFIRSNYLVTAVAVLGAIMLVLTGLLIIEYRFFVHQLDELTQLKQEYDNYILLFKRMMLQEENQDSANGDHLRCEHTGGDRTLGEDLGSSEKKK